MPTVSSLIIIEKSYKNRKCNFNVTVLYPLMVQPFRLTYLAGRGGGGVPIPPLIS